MVPLVQSPKAPAGPEKRLCRKTISLVVLGQSKALPLQSVLPGPTTVHMYISVSPEQVQVLSGETNSLFAASAAIR